MRLTAPFSSGICAFRIPMRRLHTLPQWHHTCHIRATGFYVQDVRYAAGAGSAGAALSRLVALVPKPRVNLTRFHGVFAPNSKYRARVTPAKRGKRTKFNSVEEAEILM